MLPTAYFARLRAELRLGEADDDVLRELATHVEDEVELLTSQGVDGTAAARTAIGRLGRPQTLAHLLRQAHYSVRPREAAFGAAPMILAAVLIGARLWQWPVAAAGTAVIVVAVTLYGLWRGRPAWFYPWAGVALTLPLVAGYLGFLGLRHGPFTDGTGALDVGLLGFVGGALYFPIGLLVVCHAVLVALRRDWLDASVLLSPLPVAFVWIVAVHRAGGLRHADDSLDGTSHLLALICVGMAVAVVAFMRARTRAMRVGVLLASAVLLTAMAGTADASATLASTAARAAILVGFLLSPAVFAARLSSLR